MVIFPWVKVWGDWEHVQKVWDRWQTLNAGILAFIASVIALNISKYHENKQRERRFIAARAFLPHALSELFAYYKQSAKLFVEAWKKINSKALTPFTLETALPELPQSYKETFSRCIEQAQPEVGDYMAAILVALQLHNSRMESLYEELTQPSSMVVSTNNVKSYLYSLAKVHVLSARLFPFARGEMEFDNTDPAWSEYQNTYQNLDVWLDEIDDLAGFTQRAVQRAVDENPS